MGPACGQGDRPGPKGIRVAIGTEPAHICPHCSTLLERHTSDDGVFWGCPGCGGRAVDLGLLRRTSDVTMVTRLWVAAHGSASRSRPCPICGNPMREVTIPDTQVPPLDVCLACKLVWFDPKEYEAFPARPTPPQPAAPEAPDVQEEARAAFAKEQVKAMSAHRDLEESYGPPRNFWKLLAGLFGMPVNEGQELLHGPPVTTWTLVILVCIFSSAAFPNLTHWIQIFGLIPSQADRYVGGTVVTAFFLHAGIFHLVSNMYFLLIFGDKVEDTIGVVRYLLLLFFATAAGGISHVALDPHHDIPVIGASAGIAGIMAFYAFRFPGVHLKFFIWTLFFWRWITVPVWGFFAFWIAMQALGTLLQIAGFSSVSALGHLGGAAVGVLFYFEWRYVADRDLSEPSPGGLGE